MSAEATGHVIRCAPYRGADLMILMMVADSVNDQNANEFWMSTGKLGQKARVARQTVCAALSRFVADGWLEDLGDPAQRLTGKPCRYRFLFPAAEVVFDSRATVPSSRSSAASAVPTTPTEGVTRDDTGCNERRHRVSSTATGGVTTGDTNPREPKINPSREGGRSAKPDTVTARTAPPPGECVTGTDLARSINALIAELRPTAPAPRNNHANIQAGDHFLRELCRATDVPAARAALEPCLRWALTESSWWMARITSVRDLPANWSAIVADWLGDEARNRRTSGPNVDEIIARLAGTA